MVELLTVSCPVCAHALPGIPVRADHQDGALTVRPDFTPGWWASARFAHPRCFGDRDTPPLLLAA